MKIALVAQHATPAPGGHARQAGDTRLIELSRSLAGRGHRVTVYARRHAASLPERIELEPGVRIEYIGPADQPPGHRDDSLLLAQVPAFSHPLHDRWRDDQPDIVHALRWTSGLAALAAARGLRVPVVQSFGSLAVAERGHQPRQAGDERIRLEPAIGRSVSVVLADSCDEEAVLTRLGVPRRSIRVVPCGVDTGEFTPDGPAAARGTRHRLVTMTGLGEQDALGTLLLAMSRLPDAELVVAGGPPRAQLRDDLAYHRLARLTDSLGLSGRVLFAGQVSQVGLPPLLRSADLLVSVGKYELSAITAVQAMACGTPVIASAVGGQVDAIIDGTTGVLVPPGHPALLAQRIRQLIAHPMLLRAFSVAAVDRARSRYSWNRIAHETLAVYDTLAGAAAVAA